LGDGWWRGKKSAESRALGARWVWSRRIHETLFPKKAATISCRAHGQNNDNPRTDFANHALVKIENTKTGDIFFYDPSYGKTYKGRTEKECLKQFQTDAIATFVTNTPEGLKKTQVTGATDLSIETVSVQKLYSRLLYSAKK
jgi:hypothetical protein